MKGMLGLSRICLFPLMAFLRRMKERGHLEWMQRGQVVFTSTMIRSSVDYPHQHASPWKVIPWRKSFKSRIPFLISQKMMMTMMVLFPGRARKEQSYRGDID